MWSKDFLNVCPAPQPRHGPAQNYLPSLVPDTYLGTTASDRTVPALFSACPEPSSVMGNCLHRVSVERTHSPHLCPFSPLSAPLVFISLSFPPHLLSHPSFSFSLLTPVSYIPHYCPHLPFSRFHPSPTKVTLQPSPALQPYSSPFPCCPMTLLFLWHQSLPVLSTIPTVSNPSNPLVLQPVFPLFFPPLSPEFLGDTQ